MPSTIQDIIASKRALIQQERAGLPGEEQKAVADLDAARTGAFSLINRNAIEGANSRNMVYSGQPIEEQQRLQAQYTGERYLPAYANLKTGFLNRRSKLDEALIGTNEEELQYGAAQQKAEADAAYKQQQLALQREKAAQSYSIAQLRTSKAKTVDPAKGYNLSHDPSGGLQFKGPNSRPVSAAQYASATGTDIRSLLASSGNKKDQSIIQAIDSGMSYDQLARKWPEVFGGI
jgi:hypothetical protein